MRHYLSCYFIIFGRFSPFNRHIFKPRSFGFHAPRLNAAPVPVPPVLSGRFRRPHLNVAPRHSAALWPARTRVPVVGLENRPDSQRVTHKLFFLRCLHFRAAVPGHRSQVEPRPPVRCVLDRWRVWVEPRPAVWPAPMCL